VSREQPARNRWDIEIFWEIRRKVQKNAGVDRAIGGRTGTFCKDRAGHALLSDCSTNERSAFIAVPLPFRGDEDRIGGSAICPRLCTVGSSVIDDVNVVIVGGSATALLWLLSSDLRATQCGAPSKPQPTTWNGRSGIWRHNYSVQMACPTAKTTRIKLTRPSPRLVYH